MPELFDMKRPLAVKYQNGEKSIMVAYYRHGKGMVYLEPFWEQKPDDKKAIVISGEVTGEGPWKIGEAVISLVGCHNTDAELAKMLSDWEFHLQTVGADYYKAEETRELARRHGAII